MRLIRKAEVVASVPERWRKTYENKDQTWKSWVHSKDKEAIYDELMASLPLTEYNVTRIIGNQSWTRMQCDECGQDVDLLVVIGQEPNYDSDTASVCFKCITRAHEMMSMALLKEQP